MSKKIERRCVLLTGATGFLGAQIAFQLLKEKDLRIIALVRAEGQAAAIQRLERAWWDNPELAAALHENSRIEVIQGDVSLPRLGLDETAYLRLIGRVTHIIHSAADLRVNVPIDVLRKTNVQGTANILAFARDAHREVRDAVAIEVPGGDRVGIAACAIVGLGGEGPIAIVLEN